jgi:hypothetical protein
MIVVRPIEITDAIFTSSTVAEPDVGETVWIPYTSAIGDRRINITTHNVYEAVTSNTDDPTVGVDKEPPTWVKVKKTNKWSMFDEVISTATVEDTTLTVVLTPDQLYNAVAGFGMSGISTVNVSMDDGGEVYDRNVDMNDFSLVDDWYDYFFEPVSRKEEFVLLDLPPFPSATLTLTATGTGSFNFGEFVIGAQSNLGVSVFGTSFGLKDFSEFKEDDFGNIQYISRPDYKLVNFDVRILKDRLGYAYRTLKGLKGIPSVWVGSTDEDDETLVYGYYRNNSLNFTTPTICDVSIQIRGLT